ncbi:DUF1090 family protein [Pseudomonas gingeri]|uniref:DUF1090 family protein n=1 Tax=Pseudomonas gingeri TaxID=117681 RepID=UPI00159FA18E|nr:DUF1090 family protein [Pseudomonas gingeri]NWA01071.1 DUF1090 family protein [Pseudomonas gingeri]NWA15364.1 DUF1090 family protein [Pseudomonas gingeri]NWA53571.1 DUF1090 family protein [Pseudomonas gingeri]NWA99168.1 DUF1090 family protein [Pseudomonas gingeri]NWB03924.1 DUF1090 family protein [Pseudomonas gingeri]
MRTSLFAPAAMLLGLFTLPVQAADLSALGDLASQLTGTAATPAAGTSASSGGCNKQIQDLQTQINTAKAKGDSLKTSGLQLAMDHASKNCTQANGQVASAPQPVAATPATAQDPKAQAVDAGIKALGGLFK